MSGTSGMGDPTGGLEGLRASIAAGNPDLYRHVALYLQVLRSVLPGRVEQACFHLATQVHVQRYLRLTVSQRLELHRRLRDRISHCSSLLTVEQLVALARRLEQEKQQQQQRRQQNLLQRLLQQGGHDDPATSTEQHHPEPIGERAPQGSSPQPPGSVRLGLSMPLDKAVLNWIAKRPDGDATPARPPDGEHSLQAGRDPETPQADDALSSDELDAISTDEALNGGDPRQEVDGSELMAALIEGLIEAGALDHGEDESEGEAADETGEDTDGGATSSSAGLAPFAAGRARGAASLQPPRATIPAAFTGGATAPGPGSSDQGTPQGRLLEAELTAGLENAASPWDQPGLPHDPLLLLRWLDGLEAALARRLRNLSHAINVDLLRLGLSRGLLPLSLLEAVLQGQIEPQASPANVLRLQLPFGLRPGAPPLQAIAILLRPVDLEMEEPRLRTCRRRIQQHRQQVRRMAQTYRRLQRRHEAHEAERLWLQDIRASRKPEH